MKKQRLFSLLSVVAGLVMLLTLPLPAIAQIEKGTLWRDAVITELDVDFGAGFHARWRFHRCDCGDLQVMVEQVAPDDMLTGELLMVDGQVLLSKGFEQQGEDIEPLIQAPSLMLQLAYSMLNRSQPKGPAAVTGKQAWNEKEKNIDFHLDTGLATGVFRAPWGVKGSGWEADPGHIRYEFVFQFTSSAPGEKTEKGSITFSGDLDFNQQAFPYSESAELEGWRVQWISRNELKAKPAEDGLTLKILRQKTKEPDGG
jgi:hypothetical protein